MKKRIFYFIGILMLCSLSVAGCKKKSEKTNSDEITIVPTQAQDISPTPSSKEKSIAGTMTKDDFPIIDGSTATIPLSEAVYSLATGATEAEAANAIVHTKTSNSYYRLMNKEVDLLIVYAPSEQVLADIEKDGNKLELKPIGKDALVFMANTSNKVESLTNEQLVNIYSGKLTNWSEVGGDEKEILAFQRPENSGSQTLMLKLVMGETPMMSGPNVKSYESMEGILEAMAEYTNEGNTLGYSVFYYAKNMYQLPELRFMKVNGVEPTLNTIYDNSYPYINEFYAVVRKDEPANSNAKKIFDWLTDTEGQTLIKNLGYVPVSMGVSENENVDNLLKEDVIPEGYCFVAASYSTSSEINSASVTIYKDKWSPVRVLENAKIFQEVGLIKDNQKIVIGYATKQEDGTFYNRYGLFDLKTNEFSIPAQYSTFSVLDEEREYYIVDDEDSYSVIDNKGNKLASAFNYGEGFGVSKEGNYYWIYDYSDEGEYYKIYDKDFKLVKEMVKDYSNYEMYNEDGTVYFSKDKFLEIFDYEESAEDEFYGQSNEVGANIFAVYYNGINYVLDRKMNVLAQKPADINYNSYYTVYGDIFSDSYYDTDTSTETGFFLDKQGNPIQDEEGNTYTNIVGDNYWRSTDMDRLDQILYYISNHNLNLLRYSDGSKMKIDIGDWENIMVNYVYKDIVVVHKMDGEQRTRIYKGTKLISDKAGLYYLTYMNNVYLTDNILLINYDSIDINYRYLLLNGNGDVEYESATPENIISIDDRYIQLERGNYWGVINHRGEYIIRSVKKELTND